MIVLNTAITDVKVLVPKCFKDERGFFMESYNKKVFDEAIGEKHVFVQDNHSHSIKNVLRGLHYQLTQPQGKLVRVVAGEICDVAVDLRKGSPTFGKSIQWHLSSKNQHILWIPPHFAHGFLVLSETADVIYKTTDYYNPSDELCLKWNDPTLAIPWPLNEPPIVSLKDKQGVSFANAKTFN